MKKRFLYPIWKFEEIEKELALLEENGWRLNKISGIRCFEFVKSTPKATKYFFTYNIPRENINMYLTEDTLQQKFNANPVKGSFIEGLGITTIFRLTKPAELAEQVTNRNIILQQLIFKRVVWGIIFLVLLLLPLTIGIILNPENFFSDVNPFYIIFFICYFLVSLSYLIYNTIGYISQKKKTIL